MKECHHLGMKNVQTIRQSRRIQLAFDLSTDDASAPRSVSSKGEERENKVHYQKDWFEQSQHKKRSFNCIIHTTLCWIFRVLCLILNYALCLLVCLFKIVRCTLFRMLIDRSNRFICHPIRCSHH